VLPFAIAVCVKPFAPRMGSKEPNPLFLASLPPLSLPPPSMDEDLYSPGGLDFQDSEFESPCYKVKGVGEVSCFRAFCCRKDSGLLI